MALYGPVETRGLSARIFYGIIYFILVIGSISMVYPFLLMLGASVTTDLDFEQWQIVPAYLTNDVALFRKWMDDRYGDDFLIAKRVHNLNVSSFRFLEKIPPLEITPQIEQRVRDWLECVKTLPDELVNAYYRDIRLTRPTHWRYSEWLYNRYHGDIDAFNKKFGTVYTRFEEVAPFEDVLTHKTRRETAPLRDEYLQFRKTLAPEDMAVALTTDGFLAYVERHIGQIDAFNAFIVGRSVRPPSEGGLTDRPTISGDAKTYASFREVVFPDERPSGGPWLELWDSYVTKRFPLLMLRVEGDFTEQYRQFLATQHKNYDKRIADYNAEHGTHLPPLAEVVYPPTMPEDDLGFADWSAFTDQHVPPEAKRLITVEGIWRDWLKSKYATPDAVNKAHGTTWRDWPNIMPPRAETDLVTFWKNRTAIRKEFLSRNYRLVLTYMLFHGRAAINTLILVLMTVFGQLTVQPLAAYGLSRFRLRYSHKVLLFLLATMAFPAEVAMIPNFLMIKELGLLNTYWALVLPGLASGMGIFLLKGYFDSLPKELYEAAMMDGAGELRMFLQITVPLSMPILAVIALGSFAGAYGGFMWAFLICQKPTMWTLMVFLWQLGRESYQSVWMASLVIAAIPTLLVFIFCQRIILRGIIVPTMK